MGIFDRFTERWSVSAGNDDRFPDDMAERLAHVGRYEAGGGRGPHPANALAPLLVELEDDPDGFVDDLVRLARRHGGWAAFGAQRWLRAVAPATMSRPGATQMADSGVAWVVGQGYGAALDPWERQRAPGDSPL